MDFAINMFLPEGFQPKEPDELKYCLKICNKACAQYFAKLLRGEWNPKENLKIGKFDVKVDSSKPLVHQDDLKSF